MTRMKRILKGYSKVKHFYALAIVQLLIARSAIAGSSDPFAKAADKTEEFVGMIAGKFAIAIATLAIVVAGIAMMMGKLRMEWFLKIAGGAILIGSAGAVASWMMA